jgi:hypothetical protein
MQSQDVFYVDMQGNYRPPLEFERSLRPAPALEKRRA